MQYIDEKTDEIREEVYAVLPLRDIVVFPHMIVPLFVGREKSIRALEETMAVDKQILLATQKNASDDDPKSEDIYDIGTFANILQLLKLPDGTVKVLVEGTARAKINQFALSEDYHQAFATITEEPKENDVEIEALSRSVITYFENYVKLNKKFLLKLSMLLAKLIILLSLLIQSLLI